MTTQLRHADRSSPARLPTRPRRLGQWTAATLFVIGSAFYVDGTGHDKIRLSFSAPTEERIVEGVRRLAGVLREQPV